MYAFIHYVRANPVLPPVSFSRLSPESGKLLPTFVNQAVHVCCLCDRHNFLMGWPK